jgi:hypothetical protein
MARKSLLVRAIIQDPQAGRACQVHRAVPRHPRGTGDLLPNPRASSPGRPAPPLAFLGPQALPMPATALILYIFGVEAQYPIQYPIP